MTETIHGIRALELGESLNFDKGYTCGLMLDRILGDTEPQQIGRFVHEEPVIASDMECFGSPKMEFEEMGEFRTGGGFRARP
jgi:hypothetical protein